MTTLKRFSAGNEFFLACLDKAGPGQECFLVGGALRDWFLGRKSADYDLITPGDPTLFAQRFAATTQGNWFFLDAQRRHSRVVCKNPSGSLSFDFAPFRRKSLEEDLRDRDFTINAMALPLHLPESTLYDPLAGLADLRQGVLRACDDESFVNDPLRLLRGVRLIGQFDLEIEPHSFVLMKRATDFLGRVAPERIKHELGRIFSLDAPLRGVSLMHELGIDRSLWGDPGNEGSPEKGFLWLEKGCAFLDLFSRSSFYPNFGEIVEEGFTKAALVKLGLFLRGYNSQKNEEGLKELRFARKSTRLLSAILRLPEGYFHDWCHLRCNERGRALWVEALGRHPLELLFVLAVLKAQDGHQGLLFVSQAWANFLHQAQDGHLPDLVEARALRREGVKERDLSSLLKAIRQEEIAGRIRNAEEALSFARRQIKRD